MKVKDILQLLLNLDKRILNENKHQIILNRINKFDKNKVLSDKDIKKIFGDTDFYFDEKINKIRPLYIQDYEKYMEKNQ